MAQNAILHQKKLYQDVSILLTDRFLINSTIMELHVYPLVQRNLGSTVPGSFADSKTTQRMPHVPKILAPEKRNLFS